MSLVTRNILIALVMTVAIVGTIVYAVSYLNRARLAELTAIEDQIAIDTLSLDTQFSLLAAAPCDNAASSTVLTGELGDLGARLSYTENQLGSDNAQVIRLKQQYSLLDFAALREVLVEKVLAVAGLHQAAVERAAAAAPATGDPADGYEVLLIGASTGGPPAIEEVLQGLGGDCPVPVLVVQHMPQGFTRAFADRLNIHLPLEVREAEDGMPMEPGRVYIAPGGWHLRITREGARSHCSLSLKPEGLAHRPAVDELFFSALPVARRTAVVLLTGMGRDGAEGMRQLAALGAYTVAQDEASSVVFGMPGAAVMLQAVREVLPLSRIGPRLRMLLAETRRPLATV